MTLGTPLFFRAFQSRGLSFEEPLSCVKSSFISHNGDCCTQVKFKCSGGRWFPMCGLGISGLLQEPSRVATVKAICLAALRHYLPFSHSSPAPMWTFPELRWRGFITTGWMQKPRGNSARPLKSSEKKQKNARLGSHLVVEKFCCFPNSVIYVSMRWAQWYCS